MTSNSLQPKEAAEEKSEDTKSETKTDQTTEEGVDEQKGEKRKRDGTSPDRDGAQKVRAKSPIKEDEPVIDSENVQLNWCK